MSAWSAQVSAEVLSTPNISAPTSFNAARGDQQVTLTWSAAGPSNHGRPDHRELPVPAMRESGGTFADSWADAGNDGTETITGLTNGTTYDFELRAVSNTGATGNAGSRIGHTRDRARRTRDADRNRRLIMTKSCSPGPLPPATAEQPSTPTASSGRTPMGPGPRRSRPGLAASSPGPIPASPRATLIHLPHLRRQQRRRQRLDLAPPRARWPIAIGKPGDAPVGVTSGPRGPAASCPLVGSTGLQRWLRNHRYGTSIALGRLLRTPTSSGWSAWISR